MRMQLSLQPNVALAPLKIGGMELFPPGVQITPEEAKKPGAAAQLIVLPAQEESSARLFTQNYSQNRMQAGLTLDGTAQAIAAYEARQDGGPVTHELDVLI